MYSPVWPYKRFALCKKQPARSILMCRLLSRPKIENKLMKSFRKIIQYLKNRLDSSTVFYRVLIFAVVAILGLLVGGNIILDKELGHIDTPWRLIIGFCLAFATLFAIWLIEEDLAEQAFEFKRRDKYLCGAIGGLLSALLMNQTWQAALAGLLLGMLLAALMRWLKYVIRLI